MPTRQPPSRSSIDRTPIRASAIFVPSLSYHLVDSSNPCGGEQGPALFLKFVVRVLRAIVRTLGVVLVGASIVIGHLRQLLRPTLGAVVTARRQSIETDERGPRPAIIHAECPALSMAGHPCA